MFIYIERNFYVSIHERKLISTDILKLKYLFIIQNDMYHYLLNLKINASKTPNYFMGRQFYQHLRIILKVYNLQ